MTLRMLTKREVVQLTRKGFAVSAGAIRKGGTITGNAIQRPNTSGNANDAAMKEHLMGGKRRVSMLRKLGAIT